MIIGEALPRNAQHFPNKLAIIEQNKIAYPSAICICAPTVSETTLPNRD